MTHGLAGNQRKELGQQLVLSINVAWKDHAMAELEKFCAELKKTGTVEFVFEDFRRHCENTTVGNPPHTNAWGALATFAAKERLIKWNGKCDRAKKASAHSRLIRVWEIL